MSSIIHTGEKYLHVWLMDKDRDISITVWDLFQEYKGGVPLEEFRKRLVERFDFNPSSIISKEELEQIGENKDWGGESYYFPIRGEMVFNEGHFRYDNK